MLVRESEALRRPGIIPQEADPRVQNVWGGRFGVFRVNKFQVKYSHLPVTPHLEFVRLEFVASPFVASPVAAIVSVPQICMVR